MKLSIFSLLLIITFPSFSQNFGLSLHEQNNLILAQKTTSNSFQAINKSKESLFNTFIKKDNKDEVLNYWATDALGFIDIKINEDNKINLGELDNYLNEGISKDLVPDVILFQSESEVNNFLPEYKEYSTDNILEEEGNKVYYTDFSREKLIELTYQEMEKGNKITLRKAFESYYRDLGFDCGSKDCKKEEKGEEKSDNGFAQFNTTADTKSKTITASTQYVNLREDKLSYLLGLGVKASGEGSFANLINNGEINSSGGINALFGIGKFNVIKDTSKITDDFRIVNTKNNYLLGFLGVGPEFVNFKNIANDTISFEQNTIKKSHWSARIGINYFKSSASKSLKGLNMLLGFSYSFGGTDNRSILTTKNLTTTLPSPTLGDSTNTIVKTNEVKVGEYQTLTFNSFSIDAFLTLKKFPTLGWYGNLNTVKFNNASTPIDRTFNANMGIFFLSENKDVKGTFNPKFGLILGWSDLKFNPDDDEEKNKFSFGITTVLGFGSYNKTKPPKSTVPTSVPD